MTIASREKDQYNVGSSSSKKQYVDKAWSGEKDARNEKDSRLQSPRRSHTKMYRDKGMKRSALRSKNVRRENTPSTKKKMGVMHRASRAENPGVARDKMPRRSGIDCKRNIPKS